MIDLIKKTVLMGVGLAAMTKEKVEEVAREIAKNAQLSSEKGQEFVDEVVGRAEKARAELDATVQRLINERLRKADVATKSDFAALEARIARLEAQTPAAKLP
jgi:polyhydroxyalkanoate synthesis regulator phasin